MNYLYGAILGDLAGQPFEFPANKGPYNKVNLHNPKSHITDDTIMTLASAEIVMYDLNPELAYKRWGKLYPEAGYGKGFREWLVSKDNTIGDSWANGCLMRASPFILAKRPDLMIKATKTSHNHEISINAVMQLYCYYHGANIMYNSSLYEKVFKIKADDTLKHIITFANKYDSAYSVQDAIIEIIGTGGDTDTNASIIGELFNYNCNSLIDEDINYVESKLNPHQLRVLKEFNNYLKDIL